MNKDTILTGIKVAHKGLHDEKNGIFENTLSAVKVAVDNNYPIEIDVHLTKDNKIVVLHDDNLKQLFNVDKKIKNLTYDEILKYSESNSDKRIPLLSEVMEIVNEKVLIIIELKTYYNIGPLEKLLVKELENYNGPIAVQSFNPFSMSWFKKNKPEYIRGLLSSDFRFMRYSFVKRVILKNLWFIDAAKPDFVAYDIEALNDKIIAKVKKKNIKLIGWTIDNEERKDKAEKLCDGMIFEKISV